MSSQKFVEHLQRQLDFLQRSCDSYDNGFEDEAVRIAVVIRVLLHNTNNSTSLLSLLNAQNISLLSTCPVTDSSYMIFSGALSLARIKIEDGKLAQAKHVPMLDSHKQDDILLPTKDWWEQVIYSSPVGRITRRQIVLAAANKDGGAHVDSKLTPQYEALQKGNLGLVFKISGHENAFVIENVHLSDLRQMGYEILNSPAIHALVR